MCLDIVSTRTILLNHLNKEFWIGSHKKKLIIFCLYDQKITVYVITSLFAECPRPSWMASKLTDAIKSVAALAILATSFGAADTISTGLTR